MTTSLGRKQYGIIRCGRARRAYKVDPNYSAGDPNPCRILQTGEPS